MMSIGKVSTQAVIFLFIVLAAIGRFIAYGDARLAVATNDTISYVNSSEAPVLSREFFSGQRLPTTNLLYKLFRPPGGYVDFVVPNTTERQVLAGYENIAFLQVILSLLGWGALAYAVSARVISSFLKFIACGMIMLIGFVPQTADWDSVMGSESLSFSLFALAFAFLIAFAHRIHQSETPDARTVWTGVCFCIIFMLWAYVRDSNNLSGIATTAIIAGTLLSRKYRNLQILRAMTLFLAFITMLGIISSMQSTRSATPMRNVYDVHVLPYASRIEFMSSLGMPKPFTPEFHAWAEKHASKTYLAFLITHPRYTATRYVQGAREAFTDYIQPYFRTPGNEWRERLISVGQVINMGFVAFLIDILLILTLWALPFNSGIKPAEPWIWLGTWLFLTAAITLFFSIIGDNIGLSRHALLPIAAFRLFFWIFLILILDWLLLRRGELVDVSN